MRKRTDYLNKNTGKTPSRPGRIEISWEYAPHKAGGKIHRALKVCAKNQLVRRLAGLIFFHVGGGFNRAILLVSAGRGNKSPPRIRLKLFETGARRVASLMEQT
jgi:hypothetical protein